jgi:AraC-like DNA-binding protein
MKFSKTGQFYGTTNETIRLDGITLTDTEYSHPVHLSREFPKYFDTTLGDYIRATKVQRAVALLPNPGLSLTDISLECGFADQSHFI